MRKKIYVFLLIVLVLAITLFAAGSVYKLQTFPSMDHFYTYYDGDVLPPPLAMSTYSITNWEDYSLFVIKYADFLPEGFVTYDMLRSFGKFVGAAFSTSASRYMYVIQPKHGGLLRITITHTTHPQAQSLDNTFPIDHYPSLPNMAYFHSDDLSSSNAQQSAYTPSVTFINKDIQYIYRRYRSSDTYSLGTVNIQFDGTSISFKDHLFDNTGLGAYYNSPEAANSLIYRLLDRNTADGAAAQLRANIKFGQSLPLILRFHGTWIAIACLLLVGISAAVVFVILRKKERKKSALSSAIPSSTDSAPPT